MVQKSDYWLLSAVNYTSIKVSFEEPVSLEDAILFYNNGRYGDIIDEDVYDSEANDGEPIGDIIEVDDGS
jgi:hypothetical protein